MLFEIHTFDDLETALFLNCDIIGINNRDLKTLKIDLQTTFNIKTFIPLDKVVVSESGIKTREDIMRLRDAGIDAMLIGTSFMEADDTAGWGW